jgi:ABC-type dipeptide/oligopeptide/nickel transport system permease component
MATFSIIHLLIFAIILLAPIAVIVGLIFALRRNRRL